MINYELKSNTKSKLNKNLKEFKIKIGKDFADYYINYYEKLKNYCFRFTRDIDEAEDLTAQSFYKALDNIDKFNKDKNVKLSTYLYTIARNSAYSNKDKAKKTLSIEYSPSDTETTMSDFIYDKSYKEKEDKDFSDEITKLKVQETLKAIDILDPILSECIKLRAIENLSYKEISIKLSSDGDYPISLSDFKDNYKDGVLELFDSELVFGKNKGKLKSIDFIVNKRGEVVDYEIISTDNFGLIEKIKIQPGAYVVFGEIPLNLSTVKSRIKNAKDRIKKIVEPKFSKILKL